MGVGPRVGRSRAHRAQGRDLRLARDSCDVRNRRPCRGCLRRQPEARPRCTHWCCCSCCCPWPRGSRDKVVVVVAVVGSRARLLGGGHLEGVGGEAGVDAAERGDEVLLRGAAVRQGYRKRLRKEKRTSL